MDWPQSLHPAQPSLGGSTKGIRKSNDDIYLIEETDKVGGGWWAVGSEQPEDSNREGGWEGVDRACPLVHLKIPASKLTLMASRQVGTKGHFWRL